MMIGRLIGLSALLMLGLAAQNCVVVCQEEVEEEVVWRRMVLDLASVATHLVEVVCRSVDCVYAWVVDMAVMEVLQAVAVDDPTGLAGYNSDLQRLQQANNLLVRLHHHWKKKPKQTNHREVEPHFHL